MWWNKKNTNKDDQKSKKIKALTTGQGISIGITALFVVGLWFVNLFWLKNHTDSTGINDRGTYGDMFGAVNALFSGLAFAGIIWTILLQRNELRLQREESQLSRDEAIDQNKTLRLQRFENTFFNMLNLQNEIVKNLKFQQLEGRQVIDEAQKQLYSFLSIENYNKANNTTGLQPQKNTLNDTPQSYSSARAMLENSYHAKFYDRFASNFNHYYRHLYHIFKFIYFSGLDLSEKKFYASLTRAQLSQGELYLIAFNILIEDYGNPNLLYLVKEYDVLQNFDWTNVTPEAFETLIKVELKNVIYPFDITKPGGTNF